MLDISHLTKCQFPSPMGWPPHLPKDVSPWLALPLFLLSAALMPPLLFWIIPICIKNKHEKLPFSHITQVQPHLSVPPPTQISRMTSLPTIEVPTFLELLKWALSRPPVTTMFCPNPFNLTPSSSWTLGWFLGQPLSWFPSSLPAHICLVCSTHI